MIAGILGAFSQVAWNTEEVVCGGGVELLLFALISLERAADFAAM
ncbi:hypothetical protein [Methylicorpusculum sp.]|nr:hypothetical protein [Methylicorpusculum sp.]MDZ4152089.1 hypothetical protein [Methylicorpusculum sp.]